MSRATHHIGQKAAQSFYYASEQAERIGLPLNMFVTINFSETDIQLRDATRVFSILRRNHFNKWAGRPGKGKGPAFAPTYAFCFENKKNDVPYYGTENGDPHNVHVHWILHINQRREEEFKKCVWEWLDGFCKYPSSSYAIEIQKVEDVKGLRRYCLKGTAHNWAKHYGAEESDQGAIVGQRSRTSMNIAPSARRRSDKELGIRRRAA